MEVKKDKTPFRLVIPEKNLTISHTSGYNQKLTVFKDAIKYKHYGLCNA
jgi:hypothetical protein